MTTLSMGDVIRTYMKIRAQKEAIESETKEKVAVLKNQLEKLEAYMQSVMDEQGLTSFKSDYGTAFLTKTDYANVSDWDATLAFIQETEAFDMLEKRVSKTAVRSYIDQHKTVPPGVNYGTRLEVQIRKPSAKMED